jgi:hypothetical protein
MVDDGEPGAAVTISVPSVGDSGAKAVAAESSAPPKRAKAPRWRRGKRRVALGVPTVATGVYVKGSPPPADGLGSLVGTATGPVRWGFIAGRCAAGFVVGFASDAVATPPQAGANPLTVTLSPAAVESLLLRTVAALQFVVSGGTVEAVGSGASDVDVALVRFMSALSPAAREALQHHYSCLQAPRTLVVADRTCLAHATPKRHPERAQRRA